MRGGIGSSFMSENPVFCAGSSLLRILDVSGGVCRPDRGLKGLACCALCRDCWMIGGTWRWNRQGRGRKGQEAEMKKRESGRGRSRDGGRL